MPKRSARKSQPKTTTPRSVLSLTPLEDRSVPHSGITEFTAGLTANAALTGIVRGADDNFWFTEYDASRIGRITRAGVITEFTLPAGRGPLNITVGGDNKLWFTSNTGDRIGRLDPLAGDSAAIQSSITEFAVPGAGSAPNDIVAGPDGALWFTESGSDQIGRITTAGSVTEFDVPGVGSTPAGITAGADGALWFTEAGSGEIGRITTAGSVTEFLVPVAANGVSDPEDIVAGPGGSLFFTDFGRDQIGRLTPAGEFTQFNLQVGRGPKNLVVDDQGDLYFTETASSRIGRLPANALAPGRPTSGEPPLEEFDFITATSAPLGIALDTNGDIFFTMNNKNSIGFFQAHLEQITIAATGPVVQIFDNRLNEVRTITPFPNAGVALNLAVQEVSNNGVPDAIIGAGPGGAPHVIIIDGGDNSVVASFFAFPPSNRAGVTVSADDVNGDGRRDVIVSSGGVVKVIDGFKLTQVNADGTIADAAVLATFAPFGSAFTGPLSLAVGDMNADKKSEIIVGAGAGGAPHVKVINGAAVGTATLGGVPDAALLGNFYAFDPSFRGGVAVTIAFNGFQRDVVVGAGDGGAPRVRFLDLAKLAQTGADGQVAAAAVRADFFVFDPAGRGGVRVAADDLDNDGLAELIASSGPGTAPQVKILNGAQFGTVRADGTLPAAATIKSFTTADPTFLGGVAIAADADHRDGPIFGPPGITVANSRRDINDVFVFQSPANPANTVLAMDVSPFSTATTPNLFEPGVLFDFRIANRDLLNTTDDLTLRAVFSVPDAQGVQDVSLRALPAARFAGTGGVLVKGLTGQNNPVRGVGGNGTAQFRAAEQDDPFFFDATGFNALLNSATAVDGVVAGKYPRGTSPDGFGPTSSPNYDAPNFFGPSVNTLNLTLEIPSSKLTGPGGTAIGVWGRTEFAGVQFDRTGRPAINTALIPPVPRGPNFPIAAGTDLRTAFNSGHPRDDRARFETAVVNTLTSFYPAGRPGGVPNADQAKVVADLLLPDILVFDTTKSAGFAGDLVTSNGTTFLAGGRKLSDDIISTELAVLTDDDLPAGLGGGPNPPAVVTQNVRDDNGLNLKDGSINPPAPLGTGAAGSGTPREAVFPYIGAPNPNPTAVPGTPPPAQ